MFHNYHEVNIKAVLAHHPVIQDEMQELLAKGTIESSPGGAGFYSNMFLILKCSGDWFLFSISGNLIATCTYLLFRMPTIKQMQQLI